MNGESPDVSAIDTSATQERFPPEISDTLVDYDPTTLQRLPVSRSIVKEIFARHRGHAALRVVETIPTLPGSDILDPNAVDRLLIRAHCEMQRLSEEFEHGYRVHELLTALLGAVSESSTKAQLRVVDIGCGTGFVLRWLARYGNLGDSVELIGADYNAALITEARRLAALEGLNCTFHVANAFSLETPADIYLSTGILHHFRGEGLKELFQQQKRPETAAFLHFDFRQSAYASPGAKLFHIVRMREPLARHDGVLSAVRAYSEDELLESVQTATGDEFDCAIYGSKLWGLPIPRVFHSLVGVRPEFRKAFERKLGARRIRSLGVRR